MVRVRARTRVRVRFRAGVRVGVRVRVQLTVRKVDAVDGERLVVRLLAAVTVAA
jgi:predicted thioesterase